MPQQAINTIRLVLVDDHEVVRIGLRTLLDRIGIIQVVGEAGTATEAVAETIRLKPDVVLMDLRLPDGTGIDACRDIRTACPGTRVIFLTSFADDDAVLAAVFGGADGYLLKEIGGETLIQSIQSIARGQSILDPAVTQPLLARMRAASTQTAEDHPEPITPQEQRVLALVADGKTNKEIAAALGLSDKTVKNYLSHVYKKLQLTRRSQAAAFYVRRSSY
ncbi:MAG: response regulator transcription factor [Nitrospirae bacterium]|nr:MAG: response regulator transcription factor [Nitrospirota bacterium]